MKTSKSRGPERCPECSGKMELLQTNGPFEYKNYGRVYIKCPIELLTCIVCGELAIRGDQTDLIDSRCEEAVREQ